MAATGRVAVQAVASPEIAGVRMRRHPLEREAGRLANVAKRIGLRLQAFLRAIETQTKNLERVVGRDMETGKLITEEVLGDDGKPIVVPVLPDEDFRENWKLYQKTVSQLLTEQRERAKLEPGKGAPAVPDDVYEAQLAELARDLVLSMQAKELRTLLSQRTIDVDSGPAHGGSEASEHDGGHSKHASDLAERMPGTPVDAPTPDSTPDILSGFDGDE